MLLNQRSASSPKPTMTDDEDDDDEMMVGGDEMMMRMNVVHVTRFTSDMHLKHVFNCRSCCNRQALKESSWDVLVAAHCS